MACKMGINGFGRIGRLVFRASIGNPDAQVVAINEPFMGIDYMVYQLKYDSVHGRFKGTIEHRTIDGKDFLIVNDFMVRVFHEKDPAAIGWGEVGAAYICESTGIFTAKEKAELHLKGGAICKQFPSAGEPNQVPAIKPYIESIYEGQIADTSTLAKCFNTNDGFKGFKCPMKEEGGGWVPDFANRYFTEDIPEGLCMYKGIADLAGVKTPVIDEILAFFQPFMGKEYLKGGTLSGANVSETKSPQRYGKFTLKDLLAD